VFFESRLLITRRRVFLTECDKSFTRTDALQKHMRIQHGDKIVTARRPPSKKSTNAGKGASKAKDRAMSEESQFSNNSQHDGAEEEEGGGGGGGMGGVEESMAVERHPELSSEFVSYTVGKAKWNWLVREHEELGNELEGLVARENELKMECEGLLNGIMRKDCG
jgi:hypothetical protein